MTKTTIKKSSSSPRSSFASISAKATVDKTTLPADRPPVVAVLGHVDHGKTTLLDTIRKTNVAGGESGGITQHIGAYQIQVNGKSLTSKIDEEYRITFIDTPGHEAFSKMRSRGTGVADLAILVVAGDDSVKPQTIESIEQIKSAAIPMIVAVNKIDLPTVNIDRVKQDLARNGVQVEGFGGDVPIVPVSAKKGTGIPELLDLILLISEMRELRPNAGAPFSGVVIESRIDRGRGMVATVIVKKGVLRGGTVLFDGNKNVGKVRAMFDEYSKEVREAPESKPVEVLGFISQPVVGARLTDAPVLLEKPIQAEAEKVPVAGGEAPATQFAYAHQELPDFLKPVREQAEKQLPILLKADVAGSLEAIVASLPKQIQVIESGVGDITDKDILRAKSSGAIVIGFGVTCRGNTAKLAETEKVIYRTYTIIYELLKELSDVAAGMKEVIMKERELGRGEIIAEFPYEKTRIAGTKIISGRLARGDMVKIMRGEEEIGKGKIKSVRLGKNDVTKVETGSECGVLFDKEVAFALQDGIIAFTIG